MNKMNKFNKLYNLIVESIELDESAEENSEIKISEEAIERSKKRYTSYLIKEQYLNNLSKESIDFMFEKAVEHTAYTINEILKNNDQTVKKYIYYINYPSRRTY